MIEEFALGLIVLIVLRWLLVPEDSEKHGNPEVHG